MDTETPAIVVEHTFPESEPHHDPDDLQFRQTTWMLLHARIYLMSVRAEVIALKARLKGVEEFENSGCHGKASHLPATINRRCTISVGFFLFAKPAIKWNVWMWTTPMWVMRSVWLWSLWSFRLILLIWQNLQWVFINWILSSLHEAGHLDTEFQNKAFQTFERFQQWRLPYNLSLGSVALLH